MKEADEMAEDIAAKLTQVQKRMVEDKSFQKRVEESPDILEEMGFSPKQISAFRLEKTTQDACSCSCAPSKGFGRGCLIPNAEGALTDP